MISALKEVMKGTFINYKGCLITRISSIQFRVFDEFFSTIEEAQAFIDKPKNLNIIS